MAGGRPRKQGFGGGRRKSKARKLAHKKGYWKASQKPAEKKTDTNGPVIEVPELAGKYTILNQIGHGGYGTVYKAIDKISKNIVAIKRIQSANIIIQYQNHPCIEAEILYKFQSCKYFPTIKEVLLDNKSGSFSIIMDYFEHDSFNKYNRILNKLDTIKYIYVLLNCVNCLSNEGYIHRDIKPGNFLYSHKYKKYLLVDFGLCQSQAMVAKQYQKDRKLRNKYIKNIFRRHSNKSNCNTQSLPIHVRDGTPGFRAPEVIFASNAQDSRIDVFSVGLILGSIMLGCNTIFNPQNDYQQLMQYISIYGFHKVYQTANLLNRKLEIRGLNRNNCVESKNYVTGYGSPKQQICKYKLSYWIQQRIGNSNINNINNRQWSNDLYDLLDELTEINPFKRPNPQKALQHKVFDQFKSDDKFHLK